MWERQDGEVARNGEMIKMKMKSRRVDQEWIRERLSVRTSNSIKWSTPIKMDRHGEKKKHL